MRVYFVALSPAQPSDPDAPALLAVTMPSDGAFLPDWFATREDAEDYARQMAASSRGEKAVVFEGEAISAFYAKPIAVHAVPVDGMPIFDPRSQSYAEFVSKHREAKRRGAI